MITFSLTENLNSHYTASVSFRGTSSAAISCMSSFVGRPGSEYTFPNLNGYYWDLSTPAPKVLSTSLIGGKFSHTFPVFASAISGYNTYSSVTTSDSFSSVTSSVESGSSELSTETKAGIGVGVGVGVLVIIGALLLFLRSRRKTKAFDPDSEEKNESNPKDPVVELPGSLRPAHELHNPTDNAELVGSDHPIGELAGTHTWPPQELDATESAPVRSRSK